LFPLINNIASSSSKREKTGINDENGQEILSKERAMQQLIEDQVKILLANIDIDINEINKHLSQRSDSDYRFSANSNANNAHSSRSPSRNRHSSSASPSRGERLPRHSISDSSGGTSDEKEQRRGSRTINGRNLEDYIENDEDNDEENYVDEEGNEEEEEGYSHNESDHNLNLKVDFVENSL
jgi:DNA mismatch repair ATPase MutL